MKIMAALECYSANWRKAENGAARLDLSGFLAGRSRGRAHRPAAEEEDGQ
jgi:sRNA-binding protein